MYVIPASWVRRPSAAFVVISALTRTKKQAWRLVTHTHTGNIRELNSALRTRSCVRLYYFGSAEPSRPSQFGCSFLAFELRLIGFAGCPFHYLIQRASRLSMNLLQAIAPVAQSTETVRPPTSDGSRIFPVRTEASAFLASHA